MRLSSTLTLLLSLALPAVAAVSMPAYAGGDGVDNGGELLSLEFTRIGREVYLALAAHPGLLDEAQLAAFDAVIKDTRVDAVRGPVIDSAGRQVDARVIHDEHYDEPVIEIDRNTWPAFIDQRVHAHQLVFHEYLRVMGVDDDNYVVSSRLTADPYARFLSIQAPVLRGTRLWEQLRDYFLVPSAPDWERLPAATVGWAEGRCFSQGNDVGLAARVRFYDRDNGTILEPSHVIELQDWNDFQQRWAIWGSFFDVLRLDPEQLTGGAGFAVRIYGDTLLVKRGEEYCYAE
jgi:hypothetical protein